MDHHLWTATASWTRSIEWSFLLQRDSTRRCKSTNPLRKRNTGLYKDTRSDRSIFQLIIPHSEQVEQ